jgi:hypothetical protein
MQWVSSSCSPTEQLADDLAHDSPDGGVRRATGVAVAGRTDVGLKAIQFLYSLLQIDDEWSVREPRGFTWWAGDYAQRVWAEPCVEDQGIWLSRLVAETLMVADAAADDRAKRLFAFALVQRPSLSASIWNADGTIRLVCTTRVYDDVVESYSRIFSTAMVMQITQAQQGGEMLAEAVGGQPAISAHPQQGRRTSHDDMLTFVDEMLIPVGQAPSQWPASDMTHARDLLKNFGCLLGSGDGNNLVAEFPFQGDAVPAIAGGETSLLEMSTEPKHPIYGRGLSVRLTLPVANPETSRVLELNTKEFETHPFGQLMGTWGLRPDNLITFAAFYPNILASPGLTENIAVQMAGRARWAAQLWANAPSTC